MSDTRQSDLDAVSVGIMWDRLVAISDEIVSALVRTSFSTIVSELGEAKARHFAKFAKCDNFDCHFGKI